MKGQPDFTDRYIDLAQPRLGAAVGLGKSGAVRHLCQRAPSWAERR